MRFVLLLFLIFSLSPQSHASSWGLSPEELEVYDTVNDFPKSFEHKDFYEFLGVSSVSFICLTNNVQK